jgi:hypothetical protein
VWDNTTKRLGIGTTSPDQPLTISSSTSTITKLISTGTGRASYINFTNSTDSRTAFVGQDGTGLFAFATGALAMGTNTDVPIIFAPNYTGGEKMRITGAGVVGVGSVGTFTGMTSFDTAAFDLVTYNVVEIRLTFYSTHSSSFMTLSTQMLDTGGTVYTPTETGWQAWAAAGTSSASGTGAYIFGTGVTRIAEFVGGYTSVIRLTGNMALAQSVRNHLEWSSVGCYAGIGSSLVLGRAMYQNATPVTMNRLRFSISGGTITGKYSILQYNS